MTMLCPADSRPGGAHVAHVVTVPPRGLSRRTLLTAIREYYRGPLNMAEQLQLVAAGGAGSQAVREAFVEGRPLQRRALLGSRRALEGLYRATRDSHATIYQLKLLG